MACVIYNGKHFLIDVSATGLIGDAFLIEYSRYIETVFLYLYINNITIEGLIDSGASRNFISKSLV